MKPHRRKGVRAVYALVLLFLALLLYQARLLYSAVKIWLTITLVQFSDVVVQLAEHWIGSSQVESETPEFIPTISADVPKRDAVVKAFRVRQTIVLQFESHDWAW